MLNSFKKILDWINGHWGALAILGGIFWSFVTALWVAFALPVIDSHIDSRVVKMANDSLGNMIDGHLERKGGFRGQLADTTGLSKNEIVPALGRILTREDSIIGRIQYLENELDYQIGYNFWVLKQVSDKSVYNGVTFWLAPDGNVYYQDVYKYLWDAKYDSYDDCYYYYPSYSNGNRIKCD